nr:hypothetical protein [Tanacetum cinerariifolium]
MDIMSRIKKQLARSQQGWVDDLSQVYGSEAIIPTVESIVTGDGRGRAKEVTKRRKRKEVASIEKAYYQNDLQ